MRRASHMSQGWVTTAESSRELFAHEMGELRNAIAKCPCQGPPGPAQGALEGTFRSRTGSSSAERHRARRHQRARSSRPAVRCQHGAASRAAAAGQRTIRRGIQQSTLPASRPTHLVAVKLLLLLLAEPAGVGHCRKPLEPKEQTRNTQGTRDRGARRRRTAATRAPLSASGTGEGGHGAPAGSHRVAGDGVHTRQRFQWGRLCARAAVSPRSGACLCPLRKTAVVNISSNIERKPPRPNEHPSVRVSRFYDRHHYYLRRVQAQRRAAV